ncbi:MAG TPA: oligosaccharide flippase family protein [Dehalococcoidia bacterium]|jgi:O-antigen/teichoic acid export membrane protein|nr:oligosaccharide flippase family protein [Dehalococcoidia bacterium]
MIGDFILAITRRLGKWLGIDLGYYLRSNFYLLIAQGVILLCGLASSVVLARLLSKEAYGQYNYIFSVIGILAISALPGIYVAIAHAAANNHDQVFIRGTKTKLKWSLIGALACLGVGLYYYLNGDSLLAKSFWAVSFLFPFYASFDTFYPFLNGRRRFDLSSWYRSGYWIGLTLAVVLAVYLTRNLLWVIIAYMATATTLEAAFLFITIRTGKLNKSDDEAAIAYGKRLTGIQAIGLAALQFDKLIIGLALGYAELAVYSIAVMIAGLPNIVSILLSRTIFPKVAVMDEGIAYTEVKTRIPWLMIGVILICGIGALLSPYVIPWLYSSKYLDSVLYTQLLFIPVILGTPAVILRRGVLQARMKARELFKLNLVVSVFELIMLVLFALKFGIFGIILARVLARALDSAYSWRLAR